MLNLSFLHLDTVDSTQEYIKRELGYLDPEVLLCVTADEQTAGRGQGSHTWVSPARKNVYMSFHFISSTVANLAQVVSVSALKVLWAMGLSPLFKWPNDLLVDGKKITGALGEVVDGHVILGIGLNVLMTQEECSQLDRKVTSMFMETGREYDVAAISQALAVQFQADLHQFQQEGFEPFRAIINDHLAYKGERVTIVSRDSRVNGTLLNVQPGGALALRHEDGTKIICHTGSLVV